MKIYDFLGPKLSFELDLTLVKLAFGLVKTPIKPLRSWMNVSQLKNHKYCFKMLKNLLSLSFGLFVNLESYRWQAKGLVRISRYHHSDVIVTYLWRHHNFSELFKVMSLEEYQARTNKFMDEIAASSVLPDILAYVRECTTCSVLPKVTGDMSGDVMPPQVWIHHTIRPWDPIVLWALAVIEWSVNP